MVTSTYAPSKQAGNGVITAFSGSFKILANSDLVVSELDANGAPNLRMRGRVAEAAEWLGITAWHVSLTHDGAHAMAFVVAEGVGP